MNREWKPGDVAMVTWRSQVYGGRTGTFKAVFSNGGCEENEAHWQRIDGGAYPTFATVTDARPLVVIDPEDREQVEQFAKAYTRPAAYIAPWPELHDVTRTAITDAMQAALRSLVESPKPAEPTGLGAVVEDRSGRKWVRSGHSCTDPNWRTSGGDEWTRYTDIPAVKVLSDGVQP